MVERAWSMRRRLAVAVIGVVALVWIAAAAYTYFDARHEIDGLLDAHLAQSATLILAQAGHELDDVEIPADAPHERARRVAFQVWEGGTVLRVRSANAPGTRLAARAEGFSTAEVNGRSWRVFGAWDASHRVLVQVGERDEPRREIAAGIAANLLAPLAVALPLLGLLAWVAIGRGLRPLVRVAGEVAARDAHDLRRVEAGRVPTEVRPLVDGLNALLERVARLLESERRFTADAAHELRTPLAALRTQAQVALAATDERTREHALRGVVAGCDRASRLVEQLLTLARLDPAAARRPQAACDLAQVARAVIAEAAPAALARGVAIELEAPGAVPLAGDADLLAVLVRNLVDNAVRFSPAGRRVRVTAARDGVRARLAVEDQGPGVASEERARLGERFHRVLGTGVDGSGLGLSIVKRIAEIHGAAVRFDGAEGGGLRVAVDFPA